MAKMTINEVRVHLGILMEKIIDQEFEEVYTMLVPQFDYRTAEVYSCFLEQTDQYVNMIADNISSPKELRKINREIVQPAIYCFYLRYHFITQSLINQSQESVIIMPDADDEFLKQIFITDCTKHFHDQFVFS